MRVVPVALLAILVLCATARGGGSIRGFVLLPAPGRLAVVEGGRVVRTVPVPRGPGPVVASVDGSRVLVANTRLGTVAQIDGRTCRRVRTFRGLGHPVDLTLLPRPEVGLVRTRYAVVADSRGWIDILDLSVGRITRRVPVPHPLALALSEPHLWVSSAHRTRLTALDVGTPARARVTARPDAGIIPTALAPDPDELAVDALGRNGTLVRVEAVSLGHRVVRRLGGRVTQLLPGYGGVVWAARADGRVVGVKAGDGRIVDVMHVPRRSRLGIVGGWLAVAHGRSLRLYVLGTRRRGTATSLPGVAGAFSFAVIGTTRPGG